MAYLIEVKDPYLNLEVNHNVKLSVTGTAFDNILSAIVALNATLPMTSYTVTRVGVTDVWTAAGIAKDARNYTTTITITAGVSRYTLTSLPQGTDAEILAFLTLAQLVAKILKVNEVTKLETTWV